MREELCLEIDAHGGAKQVVVLCKCCVSYSYPFSRWNPFNSVLVLYMFIMKFVFVFCFGVLKWRGGGCLGQCRSYIKSRRAALRPRPAEGGAAAGDVVGSPAAIATASVNAAASASITPPYGLAID